MFDKKRVQENRTYQLSEFQRQVLVGSMLGDGSLTRTIGGTNSHFNESHSGDQIDYCRWKYLVLLPFTSAWNETPVPRTIRNPDGSFGKSDTLSTYRVSFGTINHPSLSALERSWYLRTIHGDYVTKNNHRIKCLPDDLKLTPLSIAVWYGDDGTGSAKRRTAAFNTQGFSVEECAFLSEKLKDFDITTSLSPNRGMPVINVASRSYFDFITLVAPHIERAGLAYKVDLANYKKPRPHSKPLTRDVVEGISQMLKDGVPRKTILDTFNVRRHAICNILSGKTKGIGYATRYYDR